jgi:hypothetical protein
MVQELGDIIELVSTSCVISSGTCGYTEVDMRQAACMDRASKRVFRCDAERGAPRALEGKWSLLRIAIDNQYLSRLMVVPSPSARHGDMQ